MLTLSELARHWGCRRQYVQQCVKKGCPLDDFESADLWRQAHTQRPPRSVLPKKSEPVQKSNGQKVSIEEAIENSSRACGEAWFYLSNAFVEGKPSQISVWLNLHTKSVEALVKAEGMVRTEMERQKVLIPITEAQASIRRVIEIVVQRLSSLPQNIAPRCNPHSPEHALNILQDECTAIIADAQKAVAS